MLSRVHDDVLMPVFGDRRGNRGEFHELRACADHAQDFHDDDHIRAAAARTRRTCGYLYPEISPNRVVAHMMAANPFPVMRRSRGTCLVAPAATLTRKTQWTDVRNMKRGATAKR